MRRVPGWVWAVGVALGLGSPGQASAAGVWVTLAAGLSGSNPTSEADLLFDSPHAPPYVAVTSVPGTVEAGTAGGTVSFGGLGTPLLLNLADGSAYLAGGAGTAPAGAKARGPGGGSAGPQASAAPVPSATIPETAALLGLKLADPTANGSRDLTATLTGADGSVLGTGTVTVPDGGYYIIGLGPDAVLAPPPPSDPPPSENPPPPPVENPPPPPVTDPPPSNNPPPVDNPPPAEEPPPTVPSDGPGPVATPEPSTLALVAVGSVAAGVGRRLRGRKSA